MQNQGAQGCFQICFKISRNPQKSRLRRGFKRTDFRKNFGPRPAHHHHRRFIRVPKLAFLRVPFCHPLCNLKSEHQGWSHASVAGAWPLLCVCRVVSAHALRLAHQPHSPTFWASNLDWRLEGQDDLLSTSPLDIPPQVYPN